MAIMATGKIGCIFLKKLVCGLRLLITACQLCVMDSTRNFSNSKKGMSSYNKNPCAKYEDGLGFCSTCFKNKSRSEPGNAPRIGIGRREVVCQK